MALVQVGAMEIVQSHNTEILSRADIPSLLLHCLLPKATPSDLVGHRPIAKSDIAFETTATLSEIPTHVLLVLAVGIYEIGT